MIPKAIATSAITLGIAALLMTTYASNQVAAKSEEKIKDSSGALELFPEKLYNAKGEEVSRDELKDKVVGIYFSAHWCPPCRQFTPKLVEFRDQNKADFEVVFVSSDQNEPAQMNYMKEADMKWLAVKFGTTDVNELKRRFAVRGIPKLVIISPDGKTITEDGRGDVTNKASSALAEWKKKIEAKS